MGLLNAGSGGWCLRLVTECKTGRPVGRWRPVSPLVGDSSMVVSVGAYALRLGDIILRRRQLSCCPFLAVPMARFPTHFP